VCGEFFNKFGRVEGVGGFLEGVEWMVFGYEFVGIVWQVKKVVGGAFEQNINGG